MGPTDTSAPQLVAYLLVSLLLTTIGGCAEEPGDPWPELRDSAAKVTLTNGSASAVYLGEGMLLTNWHVCWAGTEIPDRATLYNAGAGAQPAYQEFATGAARADSVAAVDGVSFPIIENGFVTFPASPPWPRSIEGDFAGKVVFAQKSLDLCVVELIPKSTSLPPTPEPLIIETREVQVGQEVIAAGYPLGVSNAVVERCHVSAPAADVRDPDLVNPTNRTVRSFAIDCKTTQHGSSGSPVFDADTGALLGLLWTGVCTKGIGHCEPPAYVSAASEWLRQPDRPPSQYSHLTALLDHFGSP